MDSDHVALKHRIRYLSKLGKKTILVGAAVVTGFALHCNVRTWNRSLQAISRQNDSKLSHSQDSWDYDWDRRNPKNPDNNVKGAASQWPKATRHVMLVRHGQYVDTEHLDKDRILTNLGRSQAIATARRLDELNLPFSRLTSSTLQRAQETTKAITKNLSYLNVELDDVLREGAPIHPVPVTENWRPHPSQFFQDNARIENAFRKYIHRASWDQNNDSFEVIVCHSNVIRYFICRALQFPLSAWIRLSIANCSLTMLTIHPDGTVVMEMMGDHGHIPAEIVTYH